MALHGSTLRGTTKVAEALARWDEIKYCNLHGNHGETIRLPAGTKCRLLACYVECVRIETETPGLIEFVDCSVKDSSVQLPPHMLEQQGAWFLRRFADDLARVQLMGGGTVKTVTFEGPGAEARALEYQAWANEKLAATVCPTKDANA